MGILFKSVGFLFSVLFFVSAGLQYNDPDSLIWIVIWAIAGLLALSFAVNKIGHILLLSSGVAALAGFFYCYPEKFEGFEIGQGDIKNVEEAREAFGLLIIALVLLLLGFRKRYTSLKV